MRTAALVCLAAAVLSAGQSAVWEQVPARPAASQPAAIVGGDPISNEALDQATRTRLFELRSREYTIQRSVLEQMIAEALIDREAKSRGMAREALVQTEVNARVAPVTDDEVRAVYESARERFPGSEAVALDQLRGSMTRQRVSARLAKFVSTLRGKYAVRVLIEPPRMDVSVDDDPADGPTDAAVTIVEFSDFECPFCARSHAALKRLREEYKGRIRLVFRDFPLPMHQKAGRAAEAASCAAEQGAFWAYHDQLFDTQRLDPSDLERLATSLGLDKAQFSGCLRGGKYTSEWQKDRDDALKYGLQGTPAYFINGRLLTGAQTFDVLRGIVEDELERSLANAKSR